MPIKTHVERKIRKHEFKAEKAARIEDSIKKTLIERLKKKEYEGIFNFPEQTFNEALDDVGAEADEEEDVEEDESIEEENEMEPNIEMEIETERHIGQHPEMLTKNHSSLTKSKSSKIQSKSPNKNIVKNEDKFVEADDDDNTDDGDISDVDIEDRDSDEGDIDDGDIDDGGDGDIDDSDDDINKSDDINDDDNESEDIDDVDFNNGNFEDDNSPMGKNGENKRGFTGDIEDIVPNPRKRSRSNNGTKKKLVDKKHTHRKDFSSSDNQSPSHKFKKNRKRSKFE